MAWRQASDRARHVGERRLRELSRQWRPVPAPGDPDRVAVADAVTAPVRVRLGGWGGPALRGLALLVVVVLAIAAYGIWMGRPRAVAEPPTVVATGVTLPESTRSSSTVMPSPAPAAATPPQPSAVALPPSSAPTAQIVVHVIGYVRRPGVVRLPPGSRVVDALDAVGGVTRRRAADSVNLARPLVDGEQLVVADHGPAPGSVVATSASGGGAPGTPTVPIVDLNAATVTELDALPGIGPVIAARIVAWRSANGRFRSVEELGEVAGIGDSILSQVRALVRV